MNVISMYGTGQKVKITCKYTFSDWLDADNVLAVTYTGQQAGGVASPAAYENPKASPVKGVVSPKDPEYDENNSNVLWEFDSGTYSIAMYVCKQVDIYLYPSHYSTCYLHAYIYRLREAFPQEDIQDFT